MEGDRYNSNNLKVLLYFFILKQRFVLLQWNFIISIWLIVKVSVCFQYLQERGAWHWNFSLLSSWMLPLSSWYYLSFLCFISHQLFTFNMSIVAAIHGVERRGHGCMIVSYLSMYISVLLIVLCIIVTAID